MEMNRHQWCCMGHDTINIYKYFTFYAVAKIYFSELVKHLWMKFCTKTHTGPPNTNAKRISYNGVMSVAFRQIECFFKWLDKMTVKDISEIDSASAFTISACQNPLFWNLDFRVVLIMEAAQPNPHDARPQELWMVLLSKELNFQKWQGTRS